MDKEEKISSGSAVLDKLLDGGYEKDILTTIYGPAGSGKTTCCLIAASCISDSKKVIYIDTEGGFSVTRLSQLRKEDYKKVLEKMLFLKPTNFDEQKTIFEKLPRIVNSRIGLIVVDTISSLYRAGFNKDEIHEINRELGKQLSSLTEISRINSIPVLVASQVYSSFDEREKVNMVGGDILKYRSKCLVEFQSFHGSKRKAILRKHRHLPEREIFFEIRDSGFDEIEKEKGFKLF